MFNLNLGLISHFIENEEWIYAPWYVVIPCMLLVCAIAYLLGSVNSAIIVSKLIYREDIRTKGSGNAGMTNMLRNYGGKAALLTLAGDLGKTVLAIVVAGIVFGFRYTPYLISVSDMCYLAGLCAVLGHIFPVYYSFKGGKGVLATATMALVLSPIAFLILILLFIGIVAVSRYVSLGSVVVAVLYPVLLHGYFAVFETFMPPFTAISAIAIAILIVWCHRTNLVRIGNRTENKLSFGKKKAKPEEEKPAGYGDEE